MANGNYAVSDRKTPAGEHASLAGVSRLLLPVWAAFRAARDRSLAHTKEKAGGAMLAAPARLICCYTLLQR